MVRRGLAVLVVATFVKLASCEGSEPTYTTATAETATAAQLTLMARKAPGRQRAAQQAARVSALS